MNPRSSTPRQRAAVAAHAHRVSIGDAARRFGVSRTFARACLREAGLASRRIGNYTREERKQIRLTA